MKVYLFISFVFLYFNVASQSALLSDSSMFKAFGQKGYKDSNKPFQNFSLVSTEGKIFTQDSLKGKITLLSFWYKNCLPCIAEFDALNSLYDKYKGNKDFQFLSFTFEEPLDVEQIRKEYNLKYPIICMNIIPIHELIFGLGFPTTVITDKNGRIKYIKCGGPEDKDDAKEIVDSLFTIELNILLAQ